MIAAVHASAVALGQPQALPAARSCVPASERPSAGAGTGAAAAAPCISGGGGGSGRAALQSPYPGLPSSPQQWRAGLRDGRHGTGAGGGLQAAEW